MEIVKDDLFGFEFKENWEILKNGYSNKNGNFKIIMESDTSAIIIYLPADN
jgi:dihydropteroate synthase